MTQNKQIDDVLLPQAELKLLNKLGKPTNAENCLAWIMTTIIYEYRRGKNGCYIPLNEIGPKILTTRSENNPLHNIADILIGAGYQARFIQDKELIGDCLEVIWE